MQKIVLIIFFMFSQLAVNAQTTNCKNFREGTFQMNFKGKAILIKRYGNIQYEYLNNAQKPTMIFDVKWINDCTYTLKPTAATLKAFRLLPKNALLTVKIGKTTPRSYFHTTSNNYSKEVISSEIVFVHQ